MEAKNMIYQIDDKDYEIVEFNTIDSTVILPGFNCKKTRYRFNIVNDSCRLTLESVKG